MRVINRNCEIILRRLLIAEGPISSADIQTSLALSRKTLSGEIQRLDAFLRPRGAWVRTVPGIGYTIEKTDPARFDDFGERFLLHVYRDRYMYFDRRYLTYLIVLELLVADSYVTVETLTTRHHYSAGTITKHIRSARAYLRKFGLDISARPSYGLILQGGEWERRVCILFTARIANGINFLQENAVPIVRTFRAMLEKDLENYLLIKREMEPVMRKYGIFCPLVYQMLVAYYVSLSQNRLAQYPLLTFSHAQLERVISGVHWAAATEMARVFKRLGFSLEENDVAALAILMRCYASRLDACDLGGEVYAPCRDDAHAFLSLVTRLYPGIAPRFDVDFFGEFVCFLATLRERLFFGLPSDEETVYAARQDGIFTADLCVDFARLYWQTHGAALSTAELMPAYYIINGAFTRKSYVQAQYRAALVSFYGIHFARNTAARLMRIYNKIIIEIVPMELAQANAADMSDFDFIITDIAINQFSDPGIPLVFSDFYREDTMRSLERFISRDAAEHFRGVIREEGIFRDVPLHSKEDAFRWLAERFVREEDRDAFIADSLASNRFLSCERKNRIALISAQPEYYDRAQVILLFARSAFWWDNEQVHLILFYNSRGRPYADIKRTNVFFRRLLADDAGVAERISRMDARALIAYVADQRFKP